MKHVPKLKHDVPPPLIVSHKDDQPHYNLLQSIAFSTQLGKINITRLQMMSLTLHLLSLLSILSTHPSSTLAQTSTTFLLSSASSPSDSILQLPASVERQAGLQLLVSVQEDQEDDQEDDDKERRRE